MKNVIIYLYYKLYYTVIAVAVPEIYFLNKISIILNWLKNTDVYITKNIFLGSMLV